MESMKGKNIEAGYYVTAYSNSKAAFLTVRDRPDLLGQVFATGYCQIDLSRAPDYDGFYAGDDLYKYDTTYYPVLPVPNII